MSRLDPSQALREGSRSLSPGRGQHRLHDWLVVAETALGLVLLVGAGLLIHSFVRILRVDPGFDSSNVLTASLALPDRYNGVQQVQFYNQLLSKVATLPGVQSTAAGWALPFAENSMRIAFDIEGRSVPKGDRSAAGAYIATPGYFATMRIPILRGRPFRQDDTAKSTPVIAINEAFARKYFPNEDPIGKRLQIGLGDGVVTSKSMREIVAVIGDVRDRKITTDAKPQYYLPFSQAAITSPGLVVRTAGDPTVLTAAIRAEVAAMDKSVPFYDVKTLDDVVSQAAAQPRFQTVLITFFAAMALLLSAVGLYAVLSYMVAQRTLEIGLRLALGAQREDVVGLILRRGLILAATGLAIGMAVALLLTRFLEGMLYGVRPFDPLTLVGVSAVLLLVSLIASSAPAYRAARLDPMHTLREQ
jgi:predicted permease